jgi:hypothetical protein
MMGLTIPMNLARVWPFLDGLAGCNMRFERENRYFWWGGLPVAPLKKPGPFGGAPGPPISSLHLLHDTFHCIASSARLDLDDPDAPSLAKKWPNPNVDSHELSLQLGYNISS